jgi:hypothetical protein
MLKQAGWEVAAVCAKGSYLSRTNRLERRFYFTLMREAEILRDTVQAIEAWSPDLILPADDHAVHLLATIGSLAKGGSLKLSEAAGNAVSKSLPNPAVWPVVERPFLLAAYAKEIGVRVPAQRSLATFGDADAFVTEHGYPLALREETPFRDEVLEVMYNEEELLDKLGEVLPPSGRRRLYLQQWVTGMTSVFEATALGGQVTASRTLEQMELVPGTHEIPSVVRVVDHPEIASSSRKIVRATGTNGFVSVRFKTDSEGLPWFTAARFRLDETSYLGIEGGVDLAKPLLEAMKGSRPAELRPRIGHIQALYPHESLRDPRSKYLRPTGDIPSDDPELASAFEGLLAKNLV